MNPTSTDDRTTDASIRSTSEGPDLRARLSTGSDGTTECTIFPAQVDDERATTTWISAAEGSYVAVEEMR